MLFERGSLFGPVGLRGGIRVQSAGLAPNTIRKSNRDHRIEFELVVYPVVQMQTTCREPHLSKMLASSKSPAYFIFTTVYYKYAVQQRFTIVNVILS